jgi:hypothetical protein
MSRLLFNQINWLSSPDFLCSSVETGPGAILPPALGKWQDTIDPEGGHQSRKKSLSHTRADSESSISSKPETVKNSNRFRLERFGKAMSGTGSWEAPGAILNGEDWR